MKSFVVEKPEALTYSPLIFSENRFEAGKLAEIRIILNTLWVKNICGVSSLMELDTVHGVQSESILSNILINTLN